MNFDVEIFFQALTSKALREAAPIAVVLAVVSFVAGVLIGLLVALARSSRFRVLRALGWTYVWIFRAIPTIVLLFFVWNALPQLIPALAGPGFLPFYAAVIGLSVNEGAYAAEIIRGGLLSIDDGQRQAAQGPRHAADGRVPQDRRAAGHPGRDPAHGQRLHHAAEAHQPRLRRVAPRDHDRDTNPDRELVPPRGVVPRGGDLLPRPRQHLHGRPGMAGATLRLDVDCSRSATGGILRGFGGAR